MKTTPFSGLIGRLCALATVGLGLLLAQQTGRAQSSDFFLKIDSPVIAGESVVEGYENQIEVVSYSFSGARSTSLASGPSGVTQGPFEFSEVNFVLLLDTKAVPLMFSRMASGTKIGKITLTGRALSSENSFIFMKLELTDAYLSSASVQGNSGDRPIVNITAVPSKILLETTPRNPNGDPGTPSVFTWDFSAALTP
jgi:type VI secretion system secreted protein Hcp